MRINLQTLAAWLDAAPPDRDCLVTGVKTDNRACSPGDVFFCLPGERTDGHLYARDAVKRGASAVVAMRPIEAPGAPVLYVADTRKALGALAQAWRSQCDSKVVCITGTAGKTTLKAALSAILSLAGKTATASGNHNNQIGLPLSILSADGDEDFWVLEAGISKPGDMEELGGVARPDLALILNVGPGHTEGLGERGTAWHKSRLLKFVADGGLGLISSDYPELVQACSDCAASRFSFCCKPGSSGEFRAETSSTPGAYRLWLGNHYLDVETPLQGSYGAETAIAAAAAASLLGVSDATIAAGLAAFEMPAQRFRLVRHNGWEIFDDTYNSNPLSMQRMLEAARSHARGLGRPLILVLGEMSELGAEAERAHTQLGSQIGSDPPAAIYWKGAYGDRVRGGLPAQAARNFFEIGEPAGFLDNLKEYLLHNPEQGVVLFKGSRVNRMEQYLDSFLQAVSRSRDAL